MPAKNILIADDDQVIRDLLMEILQREGYQIFLASNGEEAVEAIKRYPIDVAILDIKMPVMDGIEALKQIKKIDSTVEVFIMTGYADIETLGQSIIDFGAFDYLLKPLKIQRKEICNAVRNALLKRDHAVKDDFLEKELNNRILQLEKDFEEKTRQLRESQIKYKEIVENSTDGILIAQDEKLKFVNPKALELTGFSEEEILSIPFIELVYPENRPMVTDKFSRRLQGDEVPSPFILRILRKDGDSFWVETNAIRTVWEGRPAVMANIKDINDRVESVKKLQESEEKYRSLVESTEDSIYLSDRDYRYLFMNGKYLSRFDVPLDEVIGRGYGEFHSEDGTKEFAEKVDEVFETDKSILYEHRSERDGRYFLRTISAIKGQEERIEAITVVSKDITDRMRADEAVRESNEQYQNLLRRSNDCIYIHDLEGNFIDANPAALELLGYTKKDIPNIGFVSLLSPDQIPKALAALEELKETGTEIAVREFRLKRKDGKYVDTETKSFLVDREGEPYAVHGIARDITDRKEAERDRERLLAELEAKNKEMESFVYSISHDLKTPLVSLQGFSSLLQRQFHDQLDEEGKHYMERIQDNVAHMDSLISDLLELSRIGRVVGPMEEIDVAALLREIQLDLAVELEEAGAELVAQEPLPVVHADPGRIRQVFTNLIENALKFRSRDRPLRIEVGCKEEGGSYRIHVADNGIGIAPQYQEQIFAPFRKLDPKTEGMGIGLALVKKIVEHHGGRVWMESEAAEGQEGGGATFYLTLPRRGES